MSAIQTTRTCHTERGRWWLELVKRSIGVVAAIAFAMDGTSQTVYPITDGNIVACNGGFGTSNAASGGPYENNQDQVATICPDQPGQAIFLTFVAFDLSADGSAPLDQMVIHDGSDVSAPIIGVYTGGDLQGQIIAASPDNASGCLTVHFTSNEVGVGLFSAVIQCGTPCWPPVPDALIVGESLPAKVCLDEPVQFDASASLPHPGRTIVDYEWNMRDGTVLNGVNVSHAFDEPGQYLVSLTVTDDVGCTNTQQTTVAVWVGTVPLFNGTTENSTVCTNATVDLEGMVEAITWNELPQVDLGGQIDLPDQVGQLFTSELEFNLFAASSTIVSPTDLQSFCVSMEHSFIGDFILSLTCPNGQNVVMHQQGGGGTFVGDANDTDTGNDIVPGVCWDYCFSSTATWGTWAASAQFGATPNVMPSSQGISLIPGTYTPVDPFTDLIGCPLNGIWTLNYVDQWAADNGTMCNWSINFNPSLYPDLTEFTPVISATADSMSWSGTELTTSAGTPHLATAIPTTPGIHPYLFSVTDDFGCTHDTTINITVHPPPQVDIMLDQGICTEQAQLNAAIVANPPPPEPCVYTLILNDSFNDGWTGGANVTVTVAGVATSYTLQGGSTVTHTFSVPFGSPFTVSYITGTWNGENSFQFFSPAGVLLYNSPQGPLNGNVWTGSSSCTNSGPVTYAWTPTNGVSATNIANPTTTINTPTFFTVVAHTTGQPWCATTDTMTVLPPSVLENDSMITHVLCNGGNGEIEVSTTGLGGPWNYRWLNAGNAVVRQTLLTEGDTLTAVAGTYHVIVSEGGPGGNGCSDTLTATITEPPLLEWNVIPTDTIICYTGTAALGAQAVGGTAPIQLMWDQGLQGSGPHNVSPSDSTVYMVFAKDAHDCITSTIDVLVAVRDTISYVPLIDFEQCSGVPFTLSVENVAGGDGEYEYTWVGASTADPMVTDSLLDDASYCVTVNDGCETPPVTSCTDVTVLHTPVLEVTADTTYGCRPFEVAFTLRDTTGGAQVAWEFGDATTANTGALVSHVYNVSSQFDVSTTVTWPNGCVTDTTLFDLVRVIPVPRAELSYTPDPLTIFEPHARFTELAGPNEVGYAWDFFDFGTSDEPDPEVTFPADIGRFYPVQLVVWNELGCRDTLLRQIHVEDVFLVHTPNSFTPNGDDLNETFFVVGNDISEEEFELNIFDRWGKIIFSTTNPQRGWDGNVDGLQAEVGVYPWRLKVRSLQTLEKRILYGSVNLIR